MIRKCYGVMPLVVLIFICFSTSHHTRETERGLGILNNLSSLTVYLSKLNIPFICGPHHLLPTSIKGKSIYANHALIAQREENKLLFTGIFTIIAITIGIYIFIRNRFRERKLLAIYEIETRIAKKVHDEIANEIYNALCFTHSEDISLKENKEKLLDSLDKVYAVTRNISREMSSIETGYDYNEQLKLMIAGYQNNDINIIIKGLDAINWQKITLIKKITTYRALQELMVNMKKHSKATVVVIDFKLKSKKILISYSDNGVGIKSGQNIIKNGLLNVENRMDSINGKVIFEPIVGKGFHLILTYPT